MNDVGEETVLESLAAILQDEGLDLAGMEQLVDLDSVTATSVFTGGATQVTLMFRGRESVRLVWRDGWQVMQMRPIAFMESD